MAIEASAGRIKPAQVAAANPQDSPTIKQQGTPKTPALQELFDMYTLGLTEPLMVDGPVSCPGLVDLERRAAHPGRQTFALLPEGRWLSLEAVPDTNLRRLTVCGPEGPEQSLESDHNLENISNNLHVFADGRAVHADVGSRHWMLSAADFETGKLVDIASSDDSQFGLPISRASSAEEAIWSGFKRPRLQMSPDGQHCVAVLQEQLWVLKMRLPPDEPSAEIAWKTEFRGSRSAISWSPSGQSFVVGNELFDIEGKGLGTLAVAGHFPHVIASAFSPDESHLYLATGEGEVLSFDLKEELQPAATRYPKVVRSLSKERLTGLALSPDGKYLALSSVDRSLRIIDAGSLQPLDSPVQPPHYDAISELTWSDNNVLRVRYEDTGVVEFACGPAKPRAKLPPSFSELQGKLDGASPTRAGVRWDGVAFNTLHREHGLSIQLPASQYTSEKEPGFRLSQDGKTLVCEGVGLLMCLDPRTLSENKAPVLVNHVSRADAAVLESLGIVPHRGEGSMTECGTLFNGQRYYSDGSELWVGDDNGDGRTLSVQGDLHRVHEATARALCFSYRKQPALADLTDPEVESSDRIVLKLDGETYEEPIRDLVWCADGESFIVANRKPSFARVALDGSVLAEVPGFDDTVYLGASDDGRFILAGLQTGEVVFLDPHSLDVVHRVQVQPSRIFQLFMRDNVLYTASEDGWISRDEIKV